MPTLRGQRTQFTWALNQYNRTEEPLRRAHFAERMAHYIAVAPANGFTAEQVAQGRAYPDEVNDYLKNPRATADPGLTEEQAIHIVDETVDVSEILRRGEGKGVLYAYGYRCAPDRLKIGITEGSTVERIAAQIGTSTPDKPVLFLEIKTNSCRALERTMHGILEFRGLKVAGGGAEWFTTKREELLAIYEFAREQEHRIKSTDGADAGDSSLASS